MSTAVVTGASAGLGVEFAQQLAQLGHDLVLVARREDRLASLTTRLTEEFPALRIRYIVADLSLSSDVNRLVDEIDAQGVTVDVLVNNAGASGPNMTEDTQPWSDHAQYLQLMMLSVAQLCHAYLPGMMKRSSGWVINVASVAGRIAMPGDGHYGSTKSYVISLSENLALSARPAGVHVCALCPGFTHTEFHEVTTELKDMKAATPKWLWYSAQQVVADALRATARGRIICVSGRLYRWVDPLFQFGPTRRLLQRFM